MFLIIIKFGELWPWISPTIIIINPSNPNISMYILHTFSMVMTRILFNNPHLCYLTTAFFSHNLCLTEQCYYKEKLGLWSLWGVEGLMVWEAISNTQKSGCFIRYPDTSKMVYVLGCGSFFFFFFHTTCHCLYISGISDERLFLVFDILLQKLHSNLACIQLCCMHLPLLMCCNIWQINKKSLNSITQCIMHCR